MLGAMATGLPEPLESSSFLVEIDGVSTLQCSRVEMPVATVDEVAYRSGSDKTHEARKQPGLASYSHLALHRGFTADRQLWDWWRQARSNDPGVDRSVSVTMLDGTGQPVAAWSFRNAFPVVHRLTALDASSSAAVVETLELTFDTMDLDVH